ncbi:MAG: hypothetical protein GY839_04285, partial [candidate division Zixibacteria bacterium]|nr:hypothetical protein [candidate division Zixibacteria bacterium]
MIANNRNTGDLIIMINILILLIAFGCQITFAYTGCLCDACNDERKEAWDLINSTMFDSHNRISTYLHTTNEVILLLKVLDYEGFQAKLASYGYFNEEQKYHGAFKVQRTSLDILTALFTQSNISQKMTSNLVIPLLKNFVRFCSEEDTLQFQIKLVLDRGRTALWCAKQYILSDEDRNAALIAVVDGSIRIPNMHPCGFPLDMLSNT